MHFLGQDIWQYRARVRPPQRVNANDTTQSGLGRVQLQRDNTDGLVSGTPRCRYGRAIDGIIVSHALDQIDKVSGDESLGKVEKLVNGLLAQRVLGLTDMKPNELKEVLRYIQKRRATK